MKHTIKFWDTSRASPIPVAIDFLFAETLSEAAREAAKRLHILKNKYPGIGWLTSLKMRRATSVDRGEV